MPLETATYVPDLVVTNPAHGDQVQLTDSHLRLIKSALKATFPNFTSAALSATQAALDAAVAAVTGTVNLLFPLGSAAAPSITPIGDTDTGLYAPGANQVAIAVGGAQAVAVNADKSVTFAGATNTAGLQTSTAGFSGPGTVPIGAVLEWWDDTLPDSKYGVYAWANGQIIASANTVCPELLARWGTKFGGNGVTTMGVMDRREVVTIGKSTMGSTSARGLLATVRSTLAAVFGEETHQLTIPELPVVTPTGTNTAPHLDCAGGTPITIPSGASAFAVGAGSSFNVYVNSEYSAITASAPTFTGTAFGGNTAHNNMQPTAVCNFIVRIA